MRLDTPGVNVSTNIELNGVFKRKKSGLHTLPLPLLTSTLQY